MADYYPLIVKAVAGLEKSTGEARRALYDRARTALLAQLRGVEPALSDAEITRERLALEEAIRKVEGEAAFQRPPDARRLRAEPPRPEPADDPAQDHHDPDQSLDQPRELADTPIAYAPRAVRSLMGMDDADSEETRPIPLSAAATARAERWSAGGSSLSDNGLRSFRESISGTAEDGGRGHPAADRDGRRYEQSPGHWQHDDAGLDQQDHGDPEHAHPLARLSPREAPARMPAVVTDQDDGRGRTLQTFPRIVRPERAQAERVAPQRPFAPPSWSAPRNINRIVAIGVIALLALGIAGVAFWFGQDIVDTIVRTPTRSPDQLAAVDGRGKINERVPSVGGADAAAPQRVVLYEEDPSNPNGIQFSGTAIWRTDRVAPAPGQKPEVAIRGEIEIPDQKVSVRLSLRRNEDKSLPASHTVEIMFTLPPNFSHGGISSIPGIMVKQGEMTRGTPLNGVAVKVTDNFFLVGLMQGESDTQRNIQLLKERSWFDIPIHYADGKRAIIAVEKGPPGERAFSDAFAAWQQQP
jgi:hypothetical protein